MECYGGGIRHTLSRKCVEDEHDGAEAALKLEKQRNCAHEHTLPPSRWDAHAMCIDCGKSL
jgi:hypothetical protein